MNLYNKFVSVVTQYPNHACISDDSHSLTYQQLLDKVNLYKQKINNLHIQENSCAIIYLPKSHEIIAWQLALNACSIAFVSLEWSQISRLNSSIDQLNPSLIITCDRVSDIVESRLIVHSNPNIYKDCSYIVFSSGSSGTPKKILLKDNPVIEVVLEQANITNMDSSQTFLWLLNPAFDASLSDIYMTILSGGHLIAPHCRPTDMKRIREFINQFNVTHTDIPPVVFNVWFNYIKKNQFPTLKHIVFGGEKCNEQIALELLNYCNLYNAYGPTETTICSSMVKISSTWTSNDIGQPLNNVFYKIVDNELHIGGTHCAIGYDNEVLDKKFYEEDGIKWFISGDLVQYQDGLYLYNGRKDRQFKHNGQLICPEEIESVATKCGASMARVSYVGNKIILKYDGILQKEKLTNYLPQWMIPHHFEPSELKLNNNWKTTG